MRKAFLIILPVLFLFSLIVPYRQLQKKVYPHTFMARCNLSNMTSDEVKGEIAKLYRQPFELKIKDRVYRMTYDQLGVVADEHIGVRSAFEENTKPFPKNLIAYVRSLFSQRLIMPPFVFTDAYRQFITSSRFDFTTDKDRVTVGADRNLNFQDNSQIYLIDGEHLKQLLVYRFGEKGARFEPRLIQQSETGKKEQIEAKNKQIQSYFQEPLQIIVPTDEGIKYAELSGTDLKRIFDVAYNEVNGTFSFTGNDTLLGYYIDQKIDPLLSRSSTVNKTQLKEEVKNAFTARSKQVKVERQYVALEEQYATQTHGEVASRYIEVDIGKQRMFLFDGGQMVKSYQISTGLYYPTPTGHFHIMNKAPEGYSDIFNVYMPYWMAFYYGWAGGQDAYFGIHELPYWISWDGQKKQRPREFLGSPHTGGCISLDIGAAQEVYDFSYVGMDVVIFE